MRKLRAEGRDLVDQNGDPNCLLPPDIMIDSFRYFAKLLCCFLVEVGGPRSRTLSSFAIGWSDLNPVWLTITNDDYEKRLKDSGATGLAAHDGLKLRFDDQMLFVTSFESGLSAAGIHYEFWVQSGDLQKLELQYRFGDLVRRGRQNIIVSL